MAKQKKAKRANASKKRTATKKFGRNALAVATNYNDLIRCSLDVVGISHFGTFLKNTEAYRRDLRR
jgi:hypothetical protein